MSAKPQNDIKNISGESEQTVNTPSAAVTTEETFNNNSKDVTKEALTQGAQKTNQINQAGAANRQPDNSSTKPADNTISAKQNSNAEVAQVMNNKQGSSFNDQPQKKSSDSSKNSDVKAVEQIANTFSPKQLIP